MQVAIEEYKTSNSNYKRERVEDDILNYAITKMKLLEIFLSISKEKIKLDAKNIK